MPDEHAEGLTKPAPGGAAARSWEALPIGVFACDRAGALVQCNRRLSELWGCSPQPGERRFPGDEAIAEVLATGKPLRGYALTIEREDGSRVAALADIDPVIGGDGNVDGTIACLQEVSARADPAKADEPLMRAVLEALPAAIYTTDAQGRITFYNEAAAALAGRRPVLGEDEWCVTWRLYLPDGTPLPHDQCPMAVALKENRSVRGVEAVAERPDGERVPFMPYPTPLRDSQGRLVGAVNMLVDLSERRSAEEDRQRLAALEERRAVEAELHQLQKMDAIGQLTGGIAHDFNNLLTAVMANIELIAAFTEDPRIAKHAAAALRATKRGAELTQQLLAFSRKQRLESKPVNVNELVAGVHEMLLRTLGGTVRVELALSDALWPALIDANQIETALLNLAINARDAMPEGGMLRIETANRHIAAAHGADLTAGDYVELAVRDSGTGMSDEIKARAFDPFFTTKEIGKGSGLGLSQVYGVAKQSGGGAEIDSVPGSGTVVRLYLPRAEGMPVAPRASAEPAAAAQPARRERVLVIDDDEDVREVLIHCLERYGYEVFAVAGGTAALEALKRRSFAAAVMDFAMPGMTGAELARRIKERWPDLPILFVTGYAERPTPFNEELARETILQKPFTPAELEARLRPLIERRAAPAPRKVAGLRSEAG